MYLVVVAQLGSRSFKSGIRGMCNFLNPHFGCDFNWGGRQCSSDLLGRVGVKCYLDAVGT